MNKFMIFLAILFISLSVRAMTPLTESDLSNVSNPLSLNINPDQIMKINNKTNVWDNSEGLNKSLPTSSGSMFHFDLNLFEDLDETEESYATNKQFSSFPWLGGNDDINNVQIFLINPVTGKDWTTLFSYDASFNNYQIFPLSLIIWKDYNIIINDETINAGGVNAEGVNQTNSNSQASGSPSITHPNNDTQSSNSPYRYNIMSGNIDMRDTYIDNRSTTIQSGSWVDIKTH
jgi:hypothetical protein